MSQALIQAVTSLFHLTTYHHLKDLQIRDDLFLPQSELFSGPAAVYCHIKTVFTVRGVRTEG